MSKCVMVKMGEKKRKLNKNRKLNENIGEFIIFAEIRGMCIIGLGGMDVPGR